MDAINILGFIIFSGCEKKKRKRKENTSRLYIRRFNMINRSYMTSDGSGESFVNFFWACPRV